MAFTAAPTFASEQGTATPKKILLDTIGAMGGFERFARLREIQTTLEMTKGANNSIQHQHFTFPHQMQVYYPTQPQRAPLRYHAKKVLIKEKQGSWLKHDGEEAELLKNQYWREPLVLLARYAWHGLGETFIKTLGPTNYEGELCQQLYIAPRDLPDYRLLISQKTSLPVARVYTLGDKQVTERFFDFKTVDGLNLPHRVSSYSNGQLLGETSYQSYSITYQQGTLSLRQHLTDILEASLDEKHIPGLQAIVAQADTVLFEANMGLESVELGIPMAADAVMPLASVSKIFAGTLALWLQDNKLLSLDRSINEYIPDIPAAYHSITVKHLLNHSHGLQDVLSDMRGPAQPESFSSQAQRYQTTFSLPLRHPPGAGWQYSQIGYELLQSVLESVSGETYPELLQRVIAKPLGLKSIGFGGSRYPVKGRLPMNYVWHEGQLAYNYLNYLSSNYTAAGVNASAKDVMSFYQALLRGEILSETARNTMWQEVILPNGSATYYGLGWGSFKAARDGTWSVGHSGGGSNWTRLWPDSNLIVVVLSNMNGAREDSLVYDLKTAVEQQQYLPN